MAGLVRLTPGEVFAQRFEVQRALAEGGMGTVYEVTDRRDGMPRALKVLLPELVAEERSRVRFNREAKVGAQIDSPHVPEVFGSGIDPESGVPWIAMELLKGSDLRQYLRERGPLPLEEARPLLEQVGSALAAAHRRGLVHRDLKPENVFLHEEGGARIVKLLDFGVAKVIDMHRTSGTGTGAIGSPMWMAPEQTSAGGRIAPATDVWSFALLTFFVLTGRFYWKAAQDDSGVAGLLRELHIEPIEPPTARAAMLAPHVTIPPGLDAWFARAMERDSTKRFRDAGEALEALLPALSPSRPIDRSEMAYAQTLTFDRSELTESADSAIRTQPMEQVELPPPGPEPTAPSWTERTSGQPQPPPAPEWEGEAATIADSTPSGEVVPHTHETQLPEARQPSQPHAPAPIPRTDPPGPRPGPSPLLLVLLFGVGAVGVAIAAAVIVLLVLRVT